MEGYEKSVPSNGISSPNKGSLANEILKENDKNQQPPNSTPQRNVKKGQVTSVGGEKLESIRSDQLRFYRDGVTRAFGFRIQQLEILANGIRQFESQFLQALHADLGKPEAEAYVSEVAFVLDEIAYTQKNLHKWMNSRPVKTSVNLAPARSYTVSEPKGQVLIIAPWNYPMQLLLAPLVGAIAAGNVACVKPSEVAPHTASVVGAMISELFDEEYIAVFQGGPEVSQALLQQKWDHIFFTGSTAIGKIVAREAARHLTSVTLELGGKSPAIVDVSANVDIAARRITWGKFFNAGQTCVAPDYVLIHKNQKQQFLHQAQKAITEFFGKDIQKSPDYSRIVNTKHLLRLQNLLTKGTVVCGAEVDFEHKYLSPTIITDVNLDDPIMREEIFGPIMPVLTYEHFEEVFEIVQTMPQPLALYVFAEDQKIQKRVAQEIPFGGGCINDTIMHVANICMPFGGVGQSGMGSSHGKASFDAFSHSKSMLKNTTKIDLPLRYQPYPPWKTKLFRLLMGR